MNALKIKSIPAAESDGAEYKISYCEIDSGRPGPCVLITAALHGTELHGTGVIRRLMPMLRRRLERGRCLLLPFANLRAIQKHQPHIDYEIGRVYSRDRVNNINGTWPGDPAGTSAQRASFALKHALVDQATHNIDLHSWNHTWAAGVLARTGYGPSLQLAKASGIRFASHSAWMPERKRRPVTPCTLTSYFNDTGRAAICIEFSGQNILVSAEVRRGLRAVQNCLKLLKMLPGRPEQGDVPQVWTNDAQAIEVAAPSAGLFLRAGIRLAAPVKKGALLGWIYDSATLETRAVRAPAAGYLQRHGCLRIDPHNRGDHHAATHPYAGQGEIVARILAP